MCSLHSAGESWTDFRRGRCSAMMDELSDGKIKAGPYFILRSSCYIDNKKNQRKHKVNGYTHSFFFLFLDSVEVEIDRVIISYAEIWT